MTKTTSPQMLSSEGVQRAYSPLQVHALAHHVTPVTPLVWIPVRTLVKKNIAHAKEEPQQSSKSKKGALIVNAIIRDLKIQQAATSLGSVSA